jgi:hypothetical protein
MNIPAIDHYVEGFNVNNPPDLENSMIVFTPNGNGYDVWTGEADRLPVDTTGGQVLTYTTEMNIDRTLSTGRSFPFYGENYTLLRISKKGAVNFTDMDNPKTDDYDEETFYWPKSVQFLLTRPQVAGFGADLVPESGGTVTYQELTDRAVVTFEDVPESLDLTKVNTFQMELFYSGEIRLTYLNLDYSMPAIGLGTARNLSEVERNGYSDLSAYYRIGDVNGNGTVDMTDVVMVSAYGQGQDPQPFFSHLADVDDDGDIDDDDALTLNHYIINLIDELPCQYN